MMMIKRKNNFHLSACNNIFLIMFLLLGSYNSLGADNVSFYGSLVEEPCEVNNGMTVTVDFEEVVTTMVDGKNYQKPIRTDINCGQAGNNVLTMSIEGAEVSGAGYGVLQTNKTGLGVKIFVTETGLPVPLNVWIKMLTPTLPKMSAVPIKVSGNALTTGDFSAGATLKIAYQ
ncbi:fimbrial protein [Serratia rubidaea]|uniref:fimbrial protein n=1 Tax=Serratia rubidaea TaxID=61652 RepID=UPI0007748417|nr:fimbrial protein [Serratia rubidaea]